MNGKVFAPPRECASVSRFDWLAGLAGLLLWVRLRTLGRPDWGDMMLLFGDDRRHDRSDFLYVSRDGNLSRDTCRETLSRRLNRPAWDV